MTSQLQSTEAGRLRDFWHYAKWWCVWLGLLSLIGYTETVPIWIGKLWQLGIGLAAGLGAACVFTMLQNSMNERRSRARSWAFALLTWFALALCVALLRS